MSRREYDVLKSSGDLVGALSITVSKTISDVEVADMIAKGATKMSMFLVGGGGGGSGDGNIAGVTGQGGCGGECIIINDIALRAKEIVITIGEGGAGGVSDSDTEHGAAGSDTILTYNDFTYTAKGGYGGDYVDMSANKIFTTYPRGYRKWGGRGGGYNNTPKTIYDLMTNYYTYTPEDYIEKYSTKTTIYYSIAGETGIKNPFDSNDSMIYGCGGGGGYNPYHWYTKASDKTFYPKIQSEFPNYGGANNAGGGRGGYGDDGASTNFGHNATSYGSGGGGGAFAEHHIYSYGGNGMQGIVKLYFYK